jgi:hypothetical protein
MGAVTLRKWSVRGRDILSNDALVIESYLVMDAFKAHM